MQHGITRLISDALKLGVVSTAGLISKIKGTIVSGSSLETTTTKSINALTATNGHNVTLSADQTWGHSRAKHGFRVSRVSQIEAEMDWFGIAGVN